ncbi:MAG: CHAT domain-containing tetratricopeptide repeat protein [Bacteroidota bacterium]
MSELPSLRTLLFFLCFMFYGCSLQAQNLDSLQAKSFEEIGENLARNANFDSAIVYIDKAYELYKKLDDTPAYLLMQIRKARFLNNSGKRDEALDLAEKSLKDCQELLENDAYPSSEAYHWYATMRYIKGERLAAYPILQKAIDIELGQEKPNENLVNYLVKKGHFDRVNRSYRSALSNYNQGLSVYQELGLEDDNLLSLIYNNLGIVYRRLDEYKKAEDKVLQSLEIKKRIFPANHPAIAASLMALANVQSRMGELPATISSNEKARAIYVQNPEANKVNLILVSFNLALNYAKNKQQDKAEWMADNALKLAESHYPPQHPYLTDAYMNTATVYASRSRASGIPWYEKVITSLGENSPLDMRIEAFINIGSNLYEQEYFLEGLEYLDRAEGLMFQGEEEVRFDREAFAAIENKINLFWLLWGKAFAYKGLAEKGEDRLGHLTQSKKYYDAVIDMLNFSYEGLRYEASRKAFLSSYLREVFEEAIWVELELHKLDPSLASLERAFELAENRKSTYLLESIRNADPQRFVGVSPQIMELEKGILAEIGRVEGELQKIQTDTPEDSLKSAELLTQKFSAVARYDSLTEVIERQYPNYYRTKYKQESIALATLQEKLAPKSLLLEFYEGSRHLFLFTISKDSYEYFQFDKDTELDSVLSAFLADTRDRNQAENQGAGKSNLQEYAAQAHFLYQQLLAPALKGKAFEELIVVADGKLSYLPFDLLLDQDIGDLEIKDWRDLPYLFQEYQIQYAYSASLRFMHEREPSQSNQLFAGFAPAYGSDVFAEARDLEMRYGERVIGELRFSREEVAGISDFYGGSTFLGADATEDVFKSKAKDFQVLHLAMHAFVNDKEAMYSGLLFAPPAEGDSLEDGFLHAFEIYNLDLNAELVILSACNTGQGKYQQGEGVVSLARAFTYAGCPNIMMSMWQADDAATRQLMQAYHEALTAGKGKVEALQVARDNYLENSDRTHPYYWGSFVLIGDDEPLERGGFPWGWVLLGLGVIGAVLFWGRRKMLS